MRLKQSGLRIASNTPASTDALFAVPGEPGSRYERYRTEARFEERRAKLESYWEAFAPYCGDSHFAQQFRISLEARAWELAVAHHLLARGHELVRTTGDNADICVRCGDRLTWIEAVCVDPGQGENAAKRRMKDRHRFHRDGERIMLRYTGAVAAKHQQTLSRLKRARIGPEDAVVLALNAGMIDDSNIEWEAPDIAKVLLGVGEGVTRIPIGRAGPVENFLQARESIQKHTGAAIDSAPFVGGRMREISAVWFSPQVVGEFLDDGVRLTVVPNDTAHIEVPAPLRFGRIVRVIEGALHVGAPW